VDGRPSSELIYIIVDLFRLINNLVISSLWKPIKGPLNDWPLGLCDARSLDFETDTIPSDIVFDDFFTENLQVLYSSNLQWYYLPDQETWEALIFKSADSEKSQAPGT
jgi:hypothetical protein